MSTSLEEELASLFQVHCVDEVTIPEREILEYLITAVSSESGLSEEEQIDVVSSYLSVGEEGREELLQGIMILLRTAGQAENEVAKSQATAAAEAGGGGGDEEEGKLSTHEAEVNRLCEMMGPSIQRLCVEYVYLVEGSSFGKAFNFLLEKNEDRQEMQETLDRAVLYFEKKDIEASKERELKAQIKSRIVRDFGEVEIKPTLDKHGKAFVAKPPLIFLEKHVTDSSKHVRYRDGVVASTNGARYLVEKDPKSCSAEDYDGGSRGKVKSKGKRGVGYTS